MATLKKSLAIVITIYKEPKHILEQCAKTFNDVEYDGQYQVYWVIHQSDKETLKAAREVDPKAVILVSDYREHWKSHQLNYALYNTTEDLICNFDVDNIPSKTFFNNGVTKLIEDKVSGVIGEYVVYNKDENVFTRIQHLEKMEWNNFARNVVAPVTGGYALIVGAGFIIWRKDLLEIGGWRAKSVTEDAEMTYILRKNGKKVSVFNDTYSIEAVPTFWAIVNQRARWYKGNIQLMVEYKDIAEVDQLFADIWTFFLGCPLITLFRLMKYVIVLFIAISLPIKLFFLFSFLFFDFEGRHWDWKKSYGDIPRSLTYPYVILDLIGLLVPFFAVYDYFVNPMGWYLTPKRGKV